MIKLKDILKEFDYGKQLFGRDRENMPWDRDVYSSDTARRWAKKVVKVYGGLEADKPPEINTDEEFSLLLRIGEFLNDPDNPVNISSELKKLLPLKSKFPEVLDPNFDMANSGEFYRGSTISFRDAMKIPHYNLTQGLHHVYQTHVSPQGSYTVYTRADRGFVSFSGDAGTAGGFVDPPSVGSHVYERGMLSLLDNPDKEVDDLNLRIPCLLIVDAKNPNLLFNPGFLQALEEYGEEETFYITRNRIQCDQIALVGLSYMLDQMKKVQPKRWSSAGGREEQNKREAIYKKLKQLHSKAA